MAETAAHLVDHVFAPLPVRQWVLSVPKRLRWHLEREPRAVSAVLHIFLRVIEAHLRATIPTASPRARLGAVSFVHRFGSALNRHVHLHCCTIDGLFDPGEDGQVRFLQAPVLTTGKIGTDQNGTKFGDRRRCGRSQAPDLLASMEDWPPRMIG